MTDVGHIVEYLHNIRLREIADLRTDQRLITVLTEIIEYCEHWEAQVDGDWL